MEKIMSKIMEESIEERKEWVHCSQESHRCTECHDAVGDTVGYARDAGEDIVRDAGEDVLDAVFTCQPPKDNQPHLLLSWLQTTALVAWQPVIWYLKARRRLAACGFLFFPRSCLASVGWTKLHNRCCIGKLWFKWKDEMTSLGQFISGGLPIYGWYSLK